MKARLRGLLREYWPYLLLSLAVMAPLLVPGYILMMDMVFVPHPPIPAEINASYPFHVALTLLSYVIPGDILQKLVLVSILLLAGIGMHRLLARLPGMELSRWAIVSASIFYMLSAFVYERMMMGQYAVVAGYALLPFFAVSLQAFLRAVSWKQLIRVVAWSLAIAIASIHTVIPAAILAVLLLAANVNRANWRDITKKLAVGALTVIIISSYWIVPILFGANTTSAALASTDQSAFTTQGGLFSLLRLQGFWAENRGLFLMPQQITPLPGIWQTIIWVGLISGFIILWRWQRKLAIIYGLSLVIACLVALIGLPGYREPHKIMALAALGMSVLAACGAQTLQNRFRGKGWLIGVCIIFVPLMSGIGMLWGFWGQLSARDYPPEWYALRTKLQQLPDSKPALFLPWHLYQRYSFSSGTTANPAPSFFSGRRIITSNDPEFRAVAPLKNDALVNDVTNVLRERKPDTVKQLGQLGVDYIIFAHEPNYQEHEYLRSQAGLRRIFAEGSIELYKVEVQP